MKSLITKTLISAFILFVSLSFLILNISHTNTFDKKNINLVKKEDEDKKKTYLYIYDSIVFIFLVMLIFYIFYNGYLKGCIKSLFLWAFFVICTPIPEAGLLFSLPLKRYFNIPMHICQAFVSVLALGMLFYFYSYEKKTIKTYLIGKLFLELINLKYFSIIIISIISSVFTSEIINNIIDYYIDKKKINYIYLKSILIIVLVLSYSLILNSLINKINMK